MKNTKRTLTTVGIVSLLLFVIVGCDDSIVGLDPIVGEWQMVSKNGDEPVLASEIEFTEDSDGEGSYTGTTGGEETHSGTWTKSNGTYTLNGSFFGIATSESFNPEFTDWNDTMTYTNEDDDTYVYNRI